ncbi:MAG: Co2+/Mg2+ efflux protein ApaG [Myxococcota bacterium]|nr:Co2+/Mg2+ efflux protein ApaG [Myxococcota bacterium]
MQPTTTSISITDGIRIAVTSRYLAEQSVPLSHRYVWAYTVRISNEGRRAARLVSRHWIITDAQGKVEEVKGPGVVGEQPHLEPGQSFQYTSGCILATSRGTMRGTYQMVRDAAPSEEPSTFDAEIAPFALELPMTMN